MYTLKPPSFCEKFYCFVPKHYCFIQLCPEGQSIYIGLCSFEGNLCGLQAGFEEGSPLALEDVKFTFRESFLTSAGTPERYKVKVLETPSPQ